MPRQYFVYVIELDPEVRTKRRFREANPLMRNGLPCVYVGSSTRRPDERFDQHKQGYKANRYARKHGLRLLPDLFEPYNPIPTRADALELEEYLADRLRKKGYGVWQG
jgi:predicted GIY-YIG superfamily endonuclease